MIRFDRYFVLTDFLLVSIIVCTILVVSNSLDDTEIISIGGDTFGSLAYFTINKNIYDLQLDDKLDDKFSDELAFYKELHRDISRDEQNPVNVALHRFISNISYNEVQFTRIYFWFFILTPLLTIYIIGRFANDDLKTFSFLIVGLCISLSSFNLMHYFAGHYSFILIFNILWVYLLYLTYINDRKIAYALGIIYSVGFIYNPYYGYFEFFIYLYSIGYVFLFERVQFRGFIKKILISLLVATPVIFAAFYPHLNEIINAHNQEIGSVYNRPASSVWGVLPWMYILPSPQHWLATESYLSFYKSAMIGSNIPENSVYIGLFNIIFYPYGLFLFWKKKYQYKENFLFRYTFGASILCFLLSLPPFIPLVNGEKLVWITGYLHSIFPMFRMYSRFGLFFLLFVSIGSGISFYYLLSHHAKYKYQILWATLIFVCVDLTPRLPILNIGHIPAVYTWLQGQPGHDAVIELPMDLSRSGKDDFQIIKMQYYQTIYKKKLLNRVVNYKDIQSPETYRIFKDNEVKYIVQHRQRYAEGYVPPEYKRYVVESVANEKFNNGVIEVMPKWATPIIQLGDVWVYEVR